LHEAVPQNVTVLQGLAVDGRASRTALRAPGVARSWSYVLLGAEDALSAVAGTRSTS